MRAEQLLRRLMMAATVLVAALVFAPAGAYAHAGHSHDVQPVGQVAKPLLARTTQPQPVMILSLAIKDGAVLSAGSDEAYASVLPASTSNTCGSCPGGCCHSGGTGCCAAFIVAAVEMGIPSLGRSQLNFVVIRGAGVTPDALPEPPKSLV